MKTTRIMHYYIPTWWNVLHGSRLQVRKKRNPTSKLFYILFSTLPYRYYVVHWHAFWRILENSFLISRFGFIQKMYLDTNTACQYWHYQASTSSVKSQASTNRIELKITRTMTTKGAEPNEYLPVLLASAPVRGTPPFDKRQASWFFASMKERDSRCS